MTSAFGVAVLISGEGTNLQAILDSVHGRDAIEVVGVASSRSEARGLERARRVGVPTAVFDAGLFAGREARDAALADWLEARGAQLVVLAGFMELLRPPFIARFRDRILNVHPSLLPAFGGLRAIEQAVEYGVRVGGVTVHLVDEGVDSGPILLQECFPLSYPAEMPVIEERVHAIEHRLLPAAIRLFATDAVRRDSENPRRLLIERQADVDH